MSNNDTERLDFLQGQKWTRWVGYDQGDSGSTRWPVFPGDDIRDEIDEAMLLFDKYNPNRNRRSRQGVKR